MKLFLASTVLSIVAAAPGASDSVSVRIVCCSLSCSELVCRACSYWIQKSYPAITAIVVCNISPIRQTECKVDTPFCLHGTIQLHAQSALRLIVGQTFSYIQLKNAPTDRIEHCFALSFLLFFLFQSFAFAFCWDSFSDLSDFIF